jgi:lipoprotein-releasing system ATP-binding protein
LYLVGASGAGKTTLLQILGTLDKPSVEKEIELRINNENILTMNDKSLSNLEFEPRFLNFISCYLNLLH